MKRIDYNRLQTELNAAGHGNKSAIVDQYCQTFGVHRATIHRNLQKINGGPKKRCPRGQRIPDNLISEVAVIKMKGALIGSEFERELATEDCIDILVNRGISGAGELSVSTVNRRLREAGFRISDPKVRVECSYANQEHQMDFSRSKYFQLVDRIDDDYILKVSRKELHYKERSQNRRLWIVAIKDSYSRVRLVRGYAAAGEDGLLGIRFLQWVWQREPDDHPFRYLPDNLKTDNGSFGKRKEVQSLLNALGINHPRSRPYNHDSQGKIESNFASIWRKYELKLAIELGVGTRITLSEYNDRAMDFCVAELDKKHTLYAETRGAAYLTSLYRAEYAPREIGTDTDLQEVAFRVDDRSVDSSGMVQYDGQLWQAPGFAREKRIMVYKAIGGDVMAELIDEYSKPFALDPWKPVEYGDFEHREHATPRQEWEQQAREEIATEKAANSTRKPTRRMLAPKARPVKPDTPFEAPDELDYEFPDIITAKKYIGRKLQRLIGADYGQYASWFDLENNLNQEAIDTIIEQIQKNNGWQVQHAN